MAPLLSNNFSFVMRKITFDINKLNFINGLKNIISYVTVVEFFKILIQACILFFCTGIYFWINIIKNFNLIYEIPYYAFFDGFCSISFCYLIFLIFLFPIILFDIFWKNYLYISELKMSFKELKDEFKNTEGNPEIKNKMREKIRSFLKKKIHFKINDVDFIVSGFLKYSIALQYNKDLMPAPKILLKEKKGYFSKIYKLGKKNNILIIKSNILSKLLYKHSKVGEYIPNFLYPVVAKILANNLNIKK
ncbi:EscU/YscU/HrcU family type III secretion system export apparatus switch protein [Buchnera aphidicola (Periphyllus lyropictus)]|nr:EscU/YscU/HrcU family type III secretion system export apparatus switch protein [Buchnera aphidicola]USS94831.1 EscU/YscU/HrcU family type III secretion system export apparatus switch protein [Buchnera aphidicola (Periphyllus lyropictus)]